MKKFLLNKTSIFSKKALEELITKNYGLLRKNKLSNFMQQLIRLLEEILKRTLELAIKKWYVNLNKKKYWRNFIGNSS